MQEEVSTAQVYASDLKRLNDLATRKQPLRDVIRNLLNSNTYNKLEEAKVPANGRVRLTKAGGKIIEWRIKE